MRRHVAVLLEGSVADSLDELRREWDPVMSAPAHVTVVYPEEVTDEPLLLQRLAAVVVDLRPFRLTFGGMVSVDGGDGGVFFEAVEATETLTELRRGVVFAPFTPIHFPFHATVVHPRTSHRGREAREHLGDVCIEGHVDVRSVAFTETTPTAFRVLESFALGSAERHECVAAILRRNGRLLLCHRHPDREWYPDTWDLPGGHVDPGERPEEALARELDEELGVVVSPPFGPWLAALHDDQLGIDLSIWLIDDWQGEVRNRAADEHDELRWVTADAYADLPLAHPSYLGLLDRAMRS